MEVAPLEISKDLVVCYPLRIVWVDHLSVKEKIGLRHNILAIKIWFVCCLYVGDLALGGGPFGLWKISGELDAGM